MKMRWLVFILLAAMMFTVTGCGPKSVVVTAIDYSDEDDATEYEFEDIISVIDLGRNFDKISLTYFASNDEWVEFNYRFLGEAMVDGVQAHHVKYTDSAGIFGSLGEVWITEQDGGHFEVANVIADGESKEDVEYYRGVFLPLAGLLAETVDIEKDWSAFEHANHSSEIRDFGAGRVWTDTYEMIHTDSKKEVTLEFARISGRSFMIRFEHSKNASGNYKIIEMVPR
ncbi:MAG: YgdI/YgdR family lipoprotein [Firmicutes bacterium]|nr:YgdI/YgdR family lipoprotein [Bacillota bacterium]